VFGQPGAVGSAIPARAGCFDCRVKTNIRPGAAVGGVLEAKRCG